MGRKRIVTTTVTQGIDSAADQDLAAILSGLSPEGDWIVKVYERLRGEQIWKANWPVAQVTESNLATAWGGGAYLCRPWNAITQKWGTSKTVNIAMDAEGVPVRDVVVPHVEDRHDSSQIAMMRMQFEMQKASGDRQFEMMQGFNQHMMALMTGILASNKPMDLAAVVALMKGGGTNSSESIAMVKEMVSLAREIGGGGEAPEDPIMKMLGMVPKLIEAKGNGAGSTPPSTPAIVAPGAVPNPPPAPISAEPTEEQKAMLARLVLLKRLKKAAYDHSQKPQVKTAPQFWVDWLDVNATAGDEAAEGLLKLCDEYTFEQIYPGLVNVDAELGGEMFREWFEMLYNDIKQGKASE